MSRAARVLCPECGAEVAPGARAQHRRSRAHRVQVAHTVSAASDLVPLVGVRETWREMIRAAGVELLPIPVAGGGVGPVPAIPRENLADLAEIDDSLASGTLLVYLEFLGRVAARVRAGEPWWRALTDEPRPPRGD